MRDAVFLIAILATTVSLSADEKTQDSDKQLLQGTWKVVALEAGGKKAPEDALKKKRFLIKADRLSLSGKPNDLRTYALHADAEPKAIDIPGSVAGEFGKGIYELKDDTLKLCFSQSTKLDRPKDFNTEGTRYLCFTLKREKTPNE